MTGDDLLRDDEVTDIHSMSLSCALAEGDYRARELVAGSHRGLNKLAIR